MKDIETLIQQGKLEEAENLALRLRVPDTTRVSILATIEMRRGDFQKAEVLFERVLVADPKHVVASGNLGQLLAGQGKFKRALPLCEYAATSAPKNEIYALNFAGCLADCDRVGDALEVLRPFSEVEKPTLRVLVALASLYRANLQGEIALEFLQRAQDLYPGDAGAEQSYADVLAELDPSEASKAFKAVEKRAKNLISLRWNWSFVELRLRNFRKGWQLYEYGLEEKIGKVGRPLPGVVRMFDKVTDLEKLDPEKYTLFTCEQGIGDQILFLGCFPQVIERFPKSMLVAEDRMIPVLQRSFPKVQVVTYGFAYSLSRQQDRLNGIFPIGSFQKSFRNSVAAFKKTRSSYLQPDLARVEKYRNAIVKRRPAKTIIGIAWTGGHWDRQKKTKSVPFEAFRHLMSDPQYTFVALQYGDVSADKAYAEANQLPVTFIEGIDFKKDLDGWFALSCACDRIISVSTALIHFAGAAGKRVDVLMGTTQGPFIWGLEDGPSIAYQDVHTWRRRDGEDVGDFMVRMREALL